MKEAVVSILPILLLLHACSASKETGGEASKPKPIIAVIVPGHQGNAVISALSGFTNEFSCLIVVPATSTKIWDYNHTACLLKYANLDNPDDLATALHGVSGVFATLVGSPTTVDDAGLKRSTNIVDAAAAANAHLVWSSQKSMRDIATSKKDSKVTWIDEKWIVPWMDAKAHIADYILKKYPQKTTIFVPADSIWESGYLHIPNLEKPYSYHLSIPALPAINIPFVANEDAAMGVLHIFKDPTAYAGKTIHFAGDRITTRDLATAFVKLQMGLPVKHVPVDAQTFAKDVTNPEGVINMYHMFNTYPLEALGSFDPAKARELLPTVKDLRSYISINENKAKILNYFKTLLKVWKIQHLEQEQINKEQISQKGTKNEEL